MSDISIDIPVIYQIKDMVEAIVNDEIIEYSNKKYSVLSSNLDNCEGEFAEELKIHLDNQQKAVEDVARSIKHIIDYIYRVADGLCIETEKYKEYLETFLEKK